MKDTYQLTIACAPFTGEALELAAQATEREFFPYVSLGEKTRVEDDLLKVRESSEFGGFIVLAVAEYSGQPKVVGTLPVSIEGSTGVLHTRLIDRDQTRAREATNAAHISNSLVSRALEHLPSVTGVHTVRAEAPIALQGAYLLHGLPIGANVELASVQPALTSAGNDAT